jgi:hypothetical protein
LAALQSLDLEGSGTLPREDLLDVLMRLNPSLTVSELMKMCDSAGKVGDDPVKYHDLISFVFNDSSSTSCSEGSRGYHGDASAAFVDERVWKQRQLLMMADLSPGVQHCIPLFLRDEDTCDVLITDETGREVACCKDSIYKASDHQLFWIDQPRKCSSILPQTSKLYLYSNSELLPSLQGPVHCEVVPDIREIKLSLSEEVLTFADYFRQDSIQDWQDYHAPGLLPQDSSDGQSYWRVLARSALARNSISIQPNGTKEVPPCAHDSQVLTVDTGAGSITLFHEISPPLTDSNCRLHVRAQFYDDGLFYDPMGHWLCFQSPLGTACVGIAFGLDGCYSFLNGKALTGEVGQYGGWQRGGDRSKGWHLFELIWERGNVSIFVDAESLVTNVAAEGESHTEEMWLVSRCGGVGRWSGLEVMHTPQANGTWDQGMQCAEAGDRPPWQSKPCEEGRWQANEDGVIKSILFDAGSYAHITPIRQCLIDSFSRVPPKYAYNPLMDGMLGNTYRILKVNGDGMVGLPSLDGSNHGIWWFPPVAKALAVEEAPPPRVSEARAVEEEPCEEQEPARTSSDSALESEPEPEDAVVVPPPSLDGLAIECWSIAGEDDVSRMERAMLTFVDALRNADVAMPDKIYRIEESKAAQHSNCFVYRFGSRRIQVATKLTDEGRVLLLVRCGGGFIDFVQFSRRHGSLDKVRLQKTSEGGRDVVRVTSVLSQGKVRAMPASRASASPLPPSGTPGRPASRSSSLRRNSTSSLRPASPHDSTQ